MTEPLRCRSEVERIIAEWGATGEILRAPAGIDAPDVYRLATKELGVWITLELSDAGEAALARAAKESLIRVTFDESCRTSRRQFRSDSGSGYDDADLAADLERHDVLVVFLWTPHMPLSVDAYAEISDACTALSLPLRAVTDPSSNRELVERVAAERAIPSEARVPLASLELFFRDLAVHAPSILLLSRGRASAPLPGYRSREAYRAYLEEALVSR